MAIPVRSYLILFFILIVNPLFGIIILDKENSPYYFTEDFIVNVNDTLIISEGTTIIISPGVNILLWCNTFIEGTEEEPVILKPLMEEIGWGYIKIIGPNVTLNLSNVKIINGRINSYDAHVNFSKIDFTNSQNLAWNDAIFRAINGSVFIQDCSVKGIKKGEGFLIHNCEGVMIKNCRFEAIPDAIEFINTNNSIIRNNYFFDIKDDAIDLNHCDNIVADSNLITYVTDRGFEIGSENFGSSTNITLYRNIITHCNEGVNFKEGSNGKLLNNTLFENTTGISCIEDTTGFGGSFAIIENTIISLSFNQDIYIDSLSEVQILYSLSDTEMLPGHNNQFADPLFRDPYFDDFSLQAESPCINNGNPISSSDPDGTVSDIGAIYFNPTLAIINAADYEAPEIKVYPNPFKNQFTIEYNLKLPSEVVIILFTINGNKIVELKNERQVPSTRKVVIYENQIPNLTGDPFICAITINDITKSFIMLQNR